MCHLWLYCLGQLVVRKIVDNDRLVHKRYFAGVRVKNDIPFSLECRTFWIATQKVDIF